jgi:hypothetical protein
MTDATTSPDPLDPTDAADGLQTHDATPSDSVDASASGSGSDGSGDPDQDRADLMDLPPADATEQD